MDFDVNKFIRLIKNRPLVYDSMLKEHKDRNVIDQIWEEIGKEMNATAIDCKNKWSNLRNSYLRHMRNQKLPSGSAASKKKKWYLAEAMSFLEDFVGQHREMTGNYSNTLSELNYKIQNVENEEPGEDICSQSDAKDVFQVPRNKNQKNKHVSAAEIPAGPTAQFLQTPVSSNSSSESPFIYFVRGLLPHIENLSTRRQMLLKEQMVKMVIRLTDEEEHDGVMCAASAALSGSYIAPSHNPWISSDINFPN